MTNGSAVPFLLGENGDGVIKAPWTKSAILTIMAALQMQGYPPYITFGTFYSLVLKKIDFPKQATNQNGDNDQQAAAHVPLHERRLYEFLCAAHPNIYTPKQVPQQTVFPQKIPSQEGNSNLLWCLELTSANMTPSQRMQTLQQQLKATSISAALSHHILQCIENHRYEKEDKKKVNKQSKASVTPVSSSQGQSISDILHKTPLPRTHTATASNQTTTIDERVQARADAKRKRQDEEEEAIQNKESSAFNHDSPWLVSIANTLWSQHKEMRRKKQHKSLAHLDKSSIHQNQSSWSLADAMQFLSTAFPGTKRRTLLGGLQQIHEIVPEWLSIQMATFSNGNTNADASIITVHGSASSMEQVHARITGKKHAVTKPPLLLVQHKEPASAQALVPQSSFVTDKKPENPLSKMVPPRPSHQSTTSDRARDEEVNDNPVPKSSKKSLRINRNLILTDADHQGGEILNVKQISSPRGLQTLFHRMNSGERI